MTNTTAKKRKVHKVTTPDGVTHTRTSVHDYTHAVIASPCAPERVRLVAHREPRREEGRWNVLSWSSRLELAQNAANSQLANYYRARGARVSVVRVEN